MLMLRTMDSVAQGGALGVGGSGQGCPVPEEQQGGRLCQHL